MLNNYLPQSGKLLNTFDIGDFTIKVGGKRTTPNVPKHDSILKPILSFEFNSHKGEVEDAPIFVEVQPLVKNIYEVELGYHEKLEVLQYLYNSLREDNILWGDAEIQNMAYYIPRNYSRMPISENTEKKIESDKNVRIRYFDGVGRDENEEPRWVVTDTDFIYTSETPMDEVRMPSINSQRFEKEYEEAIRKNELASLIGKYRNAVAIHVQVKEKDDSTGNEYEIE